jgi:hypothetical protein
VQSLSCSPWLMGSGSQEGNIEERVTQTGTNPTCATSLYTRNDPVYSYSAFSQWLVMRFRFFRALTDPWLAIHTYNTSIPTLSLHHYPSTMSFLTRLPRAAPALKRAYATVADASGVKVAGVESAAPAATSSVTVVVKAGSRYETKPGAAHVLKSFAFKVGLLS